MALTQFLKKNNLQPNDIDTLILGFNGDVVGDSFYHQIIKPLFNTQQILSFKNLVGEYPTVSGFALWLACLPTPLPNEAIYREGLTKGKHILIYNHYQGATHGFTLISK